MRWENATDIANPPFTGAAGLDQRALAQFESWGVFATIVRSLAHLRILTVSMMSADCTAD